MRTERSKIVFMRHSKSIGRFLHLNNQTIKTDVPFVFMVAHYNLSHHLLKCFKNQTEISKFSYIKNGSSFPKRLLKKALKLSFGVKEVQIKLFQFVELFKNIAF